MQQHSSLEKLTPKEQGTLRLLLHGRTSKEMARLEKVTPSAIDRRIEKIRAKLGCNNRRELVIRYANHSEFTQSEPPQLEESRSLGETSKSEPITVSLDEFGARNTPPRVIKADRGSDPETQLGKSRARARIEWLGSEVTWLHLLIAANLTLVLYVALS